MTGIGQATNVRGDEPRASGSTGSGHVDGPNPAPLGRNRRLRRRRRVLLAVACLAWLGWAGEPALRAQPAGPAAEGEAPPERPLPPAQDFVVKTILENRTQDPTLILRNIESLIDLDHADYARDLVKRLAGQQLTDEQLAAAFRALGSPSFVKMRTAEKPAGLKALAQKFVDGAKKYHTDPKQIAAWLDKLKDPSAQVRGKHAHLLRYSGEAALNPLLARLADAAPLDRARYVAVLVALGNDVAEPLLAALASSKPGTAAAAAEALGRLEYRRALPFLVRPAYGVEADDAVRQAAEGALRQISGRTPQQAVMLEVLRQSAESYFVRAQPFPNTVDGVVTVWDWDDSGQAVTPRPSDLDGASARAAEHLARDLLALDPAHERAHRIVTASRLEAAVLKNGPDKPLPPDVLKELSSLDRDRVLALLKADLSEPVAARRPIVMLGAVQVLGSLKDATLLASDGPEFSPLVRAALNGHPRVRIAAAEAVFATAGDKQYPGSSLILDLLGSMIQADGRPKAIVCENNTLAGEWMSGLLTQLGYRTELVRTGHELFTIAARQPDTDVVLVGWKLKHPEAPYAIGQLRKDARTATLPVGIVAELDDRIRADRTASIDDLAEVVLRPQQANAVETQLGRLLARRRPFDVISPEERLAQGSRAMRLLLDLGEGAAKVYDLSRIEEPLVVCLYSSQLSEPGAEMLGRLRSATAQKALVDFVSEAPVAVERRQAAATAFAGSVERFGTLLTATDVLRQFERFNGSERAAEADQKLLGSLLDAIEARARKERERNR